MADLLRVYSIFPLKTVEEYWRLLFLYVGSYKYTYDQYMDFSYEITKDSHMGR